MVRWGHASEGDGQSCPRLTKCLPSSWPAAATPAQLYASVLSQWTSTMQQQTSLQLVLGGEQEAISIAVSICCPSCLQQQHHSQLVHRGEQEVPKGLHQEVQAPGPPPCTSALATGITHGSLESLPEMQVKVQVSTGKGHKE